MTSPHIDGNGSTDIAGLTKDWDFVPSPTLWLVSRRSVRTLLRARSAPRYAVLKLPDQRDEWIVYFIYSPDGTLTEDRIFTLSRLRDLGIPVLAVCASHAPDRMDPRLAGFADALIWKDLSGYDFSAYAIALDVIATRSPGASVCVINDSVFGPFSDLRPVLRHPQWDFIGFTASSLFENHIQSYAFVARNVTPQFMRGMRSIFPVRYAYNRPGDVILCQELPMARVAHRHGRVGALWYGEPGAVRDPTLNRPLELVDAGFPFLKKSLLSKRVSFADRDAVVAKLDQLQHPLVP